MWKVKKKVKVMWATLDSFLLPFPLIIPSIFISQPQVFKVGQESFYVFLFWMIVASGSSAVMEQLICLQCLVRSKMCFLLLKVFFESVSFALQVLLLSKSHVGFPALP